MTDRERDLGAALGAMVKSLSGRVPVIGEAISGLDAYRRSAHDRLVRRMLGYLYDKVEDLEQFGANEWFQTEEGQLFVRKVVDASIDIQCEEKQELFVNALINGPSTDIPIKEKTKFVDMLRQLSFTSILILAEMHKKYAPLAVRPGRPRGLDAPPQIEAVAWAQELSDRFDPYVVVSSVKELESLGLFSNVRSWNKVGDKFQSGGGFATEVMYTDFTSRFCEFITLSNQ